MKSESEYFEKAEGFLPGLLLMHRDVSPCPDSWDRRDPGTAQGAGEGGVGSANTDCERQSAVSFLGPDANV